MDSHQLMAGDRVTSTSREACLSYGTYDERKS